MLWNHGWNVDNVHKDAIGTKWNLKQMPLKTSATQHDHIEKSSPISNGTNYISWIVKRFELCLNSIVKRLPSTYWNTLIDISQLTGILWSMNILVNSFKFDWMPFHPDVQSKMFDFANELWCPILLDGRLLNTIFWINSRYSIKIQGINDPELTGFKGFEKSPFQHSR